jgi:hypothetical protein
MSNGKYFRTGLRHLLILQRGVLERAAAFDGLSHRPRDPARFQLVRRRAEDALNGLESIQQLQRLARPQAGYELQREPVKTLFIREYGSRRRHIVGVSLREGSGAAHPMFSGTSLFDAASPVG